MQVNKLKDLYDMKLMSYDSYNAEHEGLLMKLWTTLRPGHELSARKSSQWKDVGFQVFFIYYFPLTSKDLWLSKYKSAN
jgi:hypothetical protein